MAEQGAKRKSATKATSKAGTKPAQKRGGAAKTKAGTRKPTKGQRAAATRKRNQAKRKRELAEQQTPSEVLEAAESKGAARTVENAATYRKLFRDWARGYTADMLAEKYKLSARRCDQIVEDLKRSRLVRMGVTDPLFGIRVANDLILRMSNAVAEYAELADSAAVRKQPQVKLAALRQRDAAMMEFVAKMQELGHLPRNLGTLKVQADTVEMAEAMLDVLEQEGVEERVVRRLIEAMELRVTKQRGRLALDLSGPHETVDGSAEEITEDAEVAA